MVPVRTCLFVFCVIMYMIVLVPVDPDPNSPFLKENGKVLCLLYLQDKYIYDDFDAGILNY